MAYEISIGSRTAKIELLNRTGSKILVSVDENKYELDLLMVEKGVYSIIFNGHSHNVELIEGDNSKKYLVNTFARTFNVEIIDAETKYQQSRLQGTNHEGDNDISSPMPGKIIKIPVKPGDHVESGQTLIVIEAMKMQSEFKSPGARIVKEILLKEGDTVNAHQVMMRLE